ncbi:hypothetical protein Pmar_PMAR003233 [Perkinsus marinus ATCC 50983]|uniref:Uncharacterized protein n=1 Tax=Perkinsus marinus (strain ATCC 50983 / TXsc) TaxID=423536 RepID=C5LKJ3_PERM5|nr:hypothetical protein Pmar_PMAR003233 [Perkinsus marinus ATCC 50983]EER02760.1 hypothetical protein Pmar_PMAR003233 [Perkinsus marinus ATCC 50983]|eukprot:XP_002770944.1 hypothetical protein Pmar_PMAR003233 [Perkinsus marinus ATCC 50983]
MGITARSLNHMSYQLTGRSTASVALLTGALTAIALARNIPKGSTKDNEPTLSVAARIITDSLLFARDCMQDRAKY